MRTILNFRSSVAMLVLSVVLVVTSGFDSCGKKGSDPPKPFNVQDAIGKARIVGAALRGSGPIVQSLIPDVIKPEVGNPIVAVIGTGSVVTTELVAAFESGDLTNALAVASRLTSIVDRLIERDALLIPAGRSRTIFLAALMGADLTLALMANSIPVPSATQAAQLDSSQVEAINAVKAFAEKPRLRARDKGTGKFVSMEYAQSHPETTVIERVKPKKN